MEADHFIRKSGIYFNGQAYKSIKECCRAYGVNYSRVVYRLRNPKYTIQEAILGGTIFLNGVRYASVNACARAYNISPKKVHQRLNNGWTLEEAVELEERESYKRGKRISYNGIEFPSMKAFAIQYNIPIKMVRYWTKKGKTPEEIYNRFYTKTNGYEYEGKKYPTMKAICDDYHIDFARFISYRQYHNKMTVQEIVDAFRKKQK